MVGNTPSEYKTSTEGTEVTAFTHWNAAEALPRILNHLLTAGDEVGSRQGDRNLEVLHPQITLTRPWQREITTPGRKASLPAQIAETMWILAGRNDVEWLSHYLPRAKEFSDDGETWRGGYGPRIRKWGDGKDGVLDPVDQLAHVVNLLKSERGTRRAVINIYDPATDSEPGKDIPCNNWLSFISRDGHLHLHVATRSNDAIWGWSGINAFEWSALLEIIAVLTGNRVGKITFSITSLHLYERHWGKAEQICLVDDVRDPVHYEDSPRFTLNPYARNVESLDELISDWFFLEERIRTGGKRHIDTFPEPMLRSWLYALDHYWNGTELPVFLKDTRLGRALAVSPERKKPEVRASSDLSAFLYATASAGSSTAHVISGLDRSKPLKGQRVTVAPVTVTPLQVSTRDVREPLAHKTEFVKFVDELHREKGKAYGDSWKKRGEQMAIMANMARKVDRLGVAGGGDTAADTVIDLLVYGIKYREWLTEHGAGHATYGQNASDEFEYVAAALDYYVKELPLDFPSDGVEYHTEQIKGWFEALEQAVLTTGDQYGTRVHPLERLLRHAFPLARHLWERENWKTANETRFWQGYGEGE